jgi:hypothetical protein
MSPLSESAVTSIVRHCPRLTNISLSMNRCITGTALIPLLNDVSRAAKLTHLHLSLKQVILTFSVVVQLTSVFLVQNSSCGRSLESYSDVIRISSVHSTRRETAVVVLYTLDLVILLLLNERQMSLRVSVGCGRFVPRFDELSESGGAQCVWCGRRYR